MRNKITKKNMDLDLRRYGNKLYSKAENNSSNSGNDTEAIDAVIFLTDETYSAVPFADTTVADRDNAEYMIELVGFKEPPAECTHIFSAEEYLNL